MGLFNKTGDIKEFDWNKKVGDLTSDGVDSLTVEQKAASDGKVGNQSLLPDNQIPQKSLVKKFRTW